MNIIEAVREWQSGITGQNYIDACDFMMALAAQYDALAPDWTQAPEWAQWYAIDANGDAYWYADEPSPQSRMVWDVIDLPLGIQSRIDLPLGIDWRLCIWQRPGVAE